MAFRSCRESWAKCQEGVGNSREYLGKTAPNTRDFFLSLSPEVESFYAVATPLKERWKSARGSGRDEKHKRTTNVQTR
ncbi:hypothetical protein [Pseudomonas sp. Z4-20]|uniref:hypothetical protein n=1 Tax=Pseudomonas sp. Z4-20 TaxID=2817414 RepID=UPI003DA9A88A